MVLVYCVEQCTLVLLYIYRSFSVHFPLADFTNPPTNLKCKVKFNPNHYPWPLVEMQWEPPDFIAAGQQNDYIVYSDNGLQFSYLVHGLHTEIELDGVDDTETIEGVYAVFVASDIPGGTNSPARCDFSTVERGIHTCMQCLLGHGKYISCVALLSFSAHSVGASVQVGVTELTILIHSTVHTVRTDRLTQRHSHTVHTVRTDSTYSQTNPPN